MYLIIQMKSCKKDVNGCKRMKRKHLQHLNTLTVLRFLLAKVMGGVSGLSASLPCVILDEEDRIFYFFFKDLL